MCVCVCVRDAVDDVTTHPVHVSDYGEVLHARGHTPGHSYQTVGVQPVIVTLIRCGFVCVRMEIGWEGSMDVKTACRS